MRLWRGGERGEGKDEGGWLLLIIGLLWGEESGVCDDDDEGLLGKK